MADASAVHFRGTTRTNVGLKLLYCTRTTDVGDVQWAPAAGIVAADH
jgi:hypothetical protein